jgi:hypothetical protein
MYTKTISNDSKSLFDLEFEGTINKIENELNGKIKKIMMPCSNTLGKHNAIIFYVLRKEERKS